MGLKITSEIHTNKGVTSEMYLNIENIILSKFNNNRSIMVNKYLNKDARDANHFDKCESYEIPNVLNLNLDINELSSVYVYELAYTKIKEELESKGLTVEDLI
jgi:hypothetical protein